MKKTEGDMMIDQWELYIRSTEGKPVSETEFDTMILPTRLMELAQEYDIKYNPEQIIPDDEGYIRDIYNAAVSLLVDVGYLNTSTGRIISFDEYEIKKSLRQMPEELTIGEGNETLCIKKRGFKDKSLPPITGAAPGAPFSEEYYLQIMQSFAMEPCVKAVHTGTLIDLNGCEIKSKTTAEMLAARREITLTREALRRAGKPGLSITGVMSGTTSEAQCFPNSPDALRSGCDRLLVSLLNELKVDWDTLKKALFCQQNNLGIAGCMSTVLGGYFGGPETTMIGMTAEFIAAFLMLGSRSIQCAIPNDAITGNKVLSEGLFAWAGSMAALTQNTKGIKLPPCVCSSGTGTEQSMREITTISGIATATGCESLMGAGTSNIVETDSSCGMNSRILDEAAAAFAGMGLSEANEIVVKLIKQYGGYDSTGYKRAPGKKFYELYDMRSLRPAKEFEETWKNTKAKLQDTFSLQFPE